MKIAIVGVGNNSDDHIRFAKAYEGAQVVAIVDSDLAKAQACARTHRIERVFGSVAEMAAGSTVDVVHVVMPTRTHPNVVREVLEAGSHVVVEQPLALGSQEAEALYRLAEARGLQLCPVHNHLFDPCVREADALIKSGALGQVVNVESYYRVNTNIPAFRDYVQPNVLPWVYQVPGGVYQEFLPRPLYLLLEHTGSGPIHHSEAPVDWRATATDARRNPDPG